MSSDSSSAKEYRFLIKRAVSAAVFFIPSVFYWSVKGKSEVCTAFTDNISAPFKRFLASVFSILPVSMAELLIICAALGSVGILSFIAVLIIRRRSGWKHRVLKAVTLILLIVLLGWSLMNMMWGVNYYSESFSKRSGIVSEGCTPEELAVVTIYFSQMLNSASEEVMRDDAGICEINVKKVFEEAPGIIDGLCDDYPFLNGRDIRPRSALLSVVMSCLSTTGYTFPYTGECMVNTDQPDAFIPFTAVHELSHQRNVASEDEANFVAALACMNCGSPDFRYSGALHAFISLSNSLYGIAPDFTNDIYGTLAEGVLADIRFNSTYWDRFETEVSEKSDEMYDSFLKGYDQPLGIKSYGAVTDLLVAYYLEDAENYYYSSIS